MSPQPPFLRLVVAGVTLALLVAVACSSGTSPTPTTTPPLAAAAPLSTAPALSGNVAQGTPAPDSTRLPTSSPNAGTATATPAARTMIPTPGASGGLLPYANDQFGFGVSVPGEWKESNRRPDNSMAQGVSFDRADNNGGFAVLTQPGARPEDLLTEFVRLLQRHGETQPLGSSQTIFAGQDWQVVALRAPNNSAVLRARLWVTQRGDRAWLLIGAGPEASWAQDSAVLEQALTTTFQFL